MYKNKFNIKDKSGSDLHLEWRKVTNVNRMESSQFLSPYLSRPTTHARLVDQLVLINIFPKSQRFVDVYIFDSSMMFSKNKTTNE